MIPDAGIINPSHYVFQTSIFEGKLYYTVSMGYTTVPTDSVNDYC